MQKTDVNTALAIFFLATTAVMLIGGLAVIPAFEQQQAQAQVGQPGGPRQIPDEGLGCHFVNPAGKVNSNPNACSFEPFPVIPDCAAVEKVQAEHDACRESSGHLP